MRILLGLPIPIAVSALAQVEMPTEGPQWLMGFLAAVATFAYVGNLYGWLPGRKAGRGERPENQFTGEDRKTLGVVREKVGATAQSVKAMEVVVGARDNNDRPKSWGLPPDLVMQLNRTIEGADMTNRGVQEALRTQTRAFVALSDEVALLRETIDRKGA